ncbi:hypothetical protein BDB00DRAFT_801086 [Zychaea mexicana]|uniref:uncharacterized protein n=1 Tax=Zychaea mexicana TaxID=64656 RepID=UPI0022FDE85E|nr:uncharacterized protein BDB00DRAFT_801086 [Zychaea mexicana]KAI9498086.1 hypothetical protein BDB00DRAFT_801086 [Zychaea mexicana]
MFHRSKEGLLCSSFKHPPVFSIASILRLPPGCTIKLETPGREKINHIVSGKQGKVIEQYH